MEIIKISGVIVSVFAILICVINQDFQSSLLITITVWLMLIYSKMKD
jgi:hypothetical protein